MAGFGFDAIVYLIVFIASIFLFGRSVYNAKRNNAVVWIPGLIHTLGFAGLIGMLFTHG